MHILFLSHYFPPESNAPAVRVYEMARRWAAWGHGVTVVTGVPNVPAGVAYEGYRNRLRQEERVDGIRVVRMYTYLAANRGVGRRTLNYLSFMCSAAAGALCVRRPDIVVATSPQFFCGWAGAAVARLRGIPFVLEVRDLWPESILAVGAVRRRGIIRFLEWLERRLYRAAHHVVTVGEGYRERLLPRIERPQAVSVVTNGVDEDRFYPRARNRTIRAEYGLGEAFVCAYVGTIGMACGLEVVLRAAERLRAAHRFDIRFLLVGDGAVRAALEAEARDRGLDTVVFAGRQPRERVPEFYAAADAGLVHLRRADTFQMVLPSKMLEVSAMGLPVVLGIEGFAADLLARSGGGFCFKPEDDARLLEILDRLRREPETGGAAGRRGCAFVKAHFNRERLARQYLSILERVVREQTAGAAARPAGNPDENASRR